MTGKEYPRLGEKVFRRTLGNGLEVIVVSKPRHAKRYAFFATRYGGMDMRFRLSGAWQDTPAGIAHYLEHKMFDTEEGNALQELAKNGASENAFTSCSMTAYYLTCTEKFYENLRILLSFVSVPYFTQESVEKEQGIIAQEIRMVEDTPDWQSYTQLMGCLYERSPARVSVAGTVESIREITAETLYEVPLLMAQEGLDEVVCRKLGLITHQPDLREWTAMVQREKNAHRHVEIALVGKYVQLHDAYLSVVESLNHAGTANDVVVDIRWVNSETLTEKNLEEELGGCAGIIVPGGFGDRGIEGMIQAVRYARENKIPYFGVCLGMQMAVIEFARHVLGYADAHSSEFSETTQHPVIALMPDQVNVTDKGGTMRLGRYPCELKEGTESRRLYGSAEISERHRHRFEFNNDYRAEMEAKGMVLAGLSPSGHLVEIVELPDHPWFVGVQFHPEFKSRPDRPHPLFYGFVKASAERD